MPGQDNTNCYSLLTTVILYGCRIGTRRREQKRAEQNSREHNRITWYKKNQNEDIILLLTYESALCDCLKNVLWSVIYSVVKWDTSSVDIRPFGLEYQLDLIFMAFNSPSRDEWWWSSCRRLIRFGTWWRCNRQHIIFLWWATAFPTSRLQ